MKKLLVISALIFCGLLSNGTYAEKLAINDLLYDLDKVLATDPGQLSEEEFYEYESAIIRGSSGSGGYFLGEPEIQWILKSEKIFKDKGINLQDKKHRHEIIGWSYFSNEEYNRAYEEFKGINDKGGLELAEWFINNKGIKNDRVVIKEYDGAIPCAASEIARIENGRYIFVAYFKGPVYRYDKDKKQHALIYAPESQYDWPDELQLDDGNLTIKLRDGAGTFIFNNITDEISKIPG
ncbi:MAG TPA: hypothetical protein DCL35_05530 [Candidatus Omnitrophica bacterium]|nr:hypothetical protein [Candidatus Omnitrophota bacterium]